MAQLSIEDVRQFLFRESRLLDDKDWDAPGFILLRSGRGILDAVVGR